MSSSSYRGGVSLHGSVTSITTTTFTGFTYLRLRAATTSAFRVLRELSGYTTQTGSAQVQSFALDKKRAFQGKNNKQHAVDLEEGQRRSGKRQALAVEELGLAPYILTHLLEILDEEHLEYAPILASELVTPEGHSTTQFINALSRRVQATWSLAGSTPATLICWSPLHGAVFVPLLTPAVGCHRECCEYVSLSRRLPSTP